MQVRKGHAERVTMLDMTEERDRSAGSGLDAALERVGDRWSLLLIEALLDGPRRFNDLAAAVAGIAPNILTDRLRRLERAGVLAYELTVDGRELAGVLRLLAAWGSGAESDGLRHTACGTTLEARWYCPTCAEAVSENEASSLRFA
jgi:DNA-binding HxlR family transcriptional regulator